MSETPQSNRPTPRTTAAVEAELRRQIRADLAQAREDANGEIGDASLASIIARAIGAALGWHLEAPEHARNATVSSRTWRPAPGPRGGGRREDVEERGPRQFDERRRPPFDREPFPGRGPRDFDDRNAPPRRGAPRDDDRERDFPPFRGPREDDRERDFPPRRGPRDDDRERDFQPRRGPQRPPFNPRGSGRPPKRPSGGGGFGPRRPPPRGR